MAARRIQFVQGAYYHIYNRGAGRLSIFHNADNYIFVLRKIKHYTRELQLTMIVYCLLPNHYHFLVRQDEQSVLEYLTGRVTVPKGMRKHLNTLRY